MPIQRSPNSTLEKPIMPLRFLPAAFAALTVLFSAASQAQAQTDNHA
jgi:hypothetical protein